MVLRPDRKRFWRNWRKRLPRLVVIVAGAAMVTLLLFAIDWTPLVAIHLGWLVTAAIGLLAVLWAGLVLVAVALGFVAVALRVDRIELDAEKVRRRLITGRVMAVPVAGASLARQRGYDRVSATGSRKRVLVPHMFYAPEDLDRLWEAAGISAPAGSTST